MKQVIYETSGRAKEYSELAINLFGGCEHGCIYCYAPLTLHKTKEEFKNVKYPRITALDVLKSAKEWKAKGETRNVLLCFVTDPYQPIEQETMITRKSIMALHEAGLNVTILTKGGLRSTRDFDLLAPRDAYATTLTCLYDHDSLKWEPHAAPPVERIKALETAHEKGIETWVSLEPIIYPIYIFNLIRLTHTFTGHYKIGCLNYANNLRPDIKVSLPYIDWYKFGWSIKDLMDSMGVNYYFKHDLLREMKVKPENFEQTWQNNIGGKK